MFGFFINKQVLRSAACCLIISAFLTGQIFTYAESIDNTKKPQASNILYILFLGIDRMEDRDSWLGVYRSDTIALAAVNPDTGKIKVLSIPRDTYTYIPVADKMDKINHAYAFGGMGDSGSQCSLDAVNHFIKSPNVSSYFTMDMEAVPQIIDDMGGIEVDADVEIYEEGIDIERGKQTLNGQQALRYVTWRNTPEADIGRIKRQQHFMKAFLDKLCDEDQLVKAAAIILDHSQYIHTNLSLDQIIALAGALKGISSSNISYYCIPGDGQYMDGISYWVPDENKTADILKQFFSEE